MTMQLRDWTTGEVIRDATALEVQWWNRVIKPAKVGYMIIEDGTDDGQYVTVGEGPDVV
jgi:hypothetical protein